MAEELTTFIPQSNASQAHGTNQSGAVGKAEPSYAVLKFMESFCLISAACGMVGNGMVLWYLGFRIRRNHFTVYILNLAAADFGYLLCIAIETVQYLMQFNVGVQFGIFLFLDLFMYGTGLYLLTAISIERCLSVLCPIWCRSHRPKLLSGIISGLLWGLSFLLNTLGYVLCTLRPSARSCRLVLITIGALDFLFCTPLMLLFSLTLFLRVKCSSQNFRTGRLFTVIMLTVLFFLIFAVPLSVLILFDFLGYKFLYSPEIGFVLSCVNSSLNPVIYFLVGSYRDRRIKFTLKLAFQRAFGDSADDKDERETHVLFCFSHFLPNDLSKWKYKEKERKNIKIPLKHYTLDPGGGGRSEYTSLI